MAVQEGCGEPLEIFENLDQLYTHLGPETRVEFVKLGNPSCEVDGLGFPSCNGQVKLLILCYLFTCKNSPCLQESFGPGSEERLALVNVQDSNKFRLMFVIEWSPLKHIFYLQYLAALTVRFCRAKDHYLDTKPGNKCRYTTRATTCVCTTKGLCTCQGNNQSLCGRTFSFGKVQSWFSPHFHTYPAQMISSFISFYIEIFWTQFSETTDSHFRLYSTRPMLLQCW